jgi:hypothetical protein
MNKKYAVFINSGKNDDIELFGVFCTLKEVRDSIIAIDRNDLTFYFSEVIPINMCFETLEEEKEFDYVARKYNMAYTTLDEVEEE